MKGPNGTAGQPQTAGLDWDFNARPAPAPVLTPLIMPTVCWRAAAASARLPRAEVAASLPPAPACRARRCASSARGSGGDSGRGTCAPCITPLQTRRLLCILPPARAAKRRPEQAVVAAPRRAQVEFLPLGCVPLHFGDHVAGYLDEAVDARSFSARPPRPPLPANGKGGSAPRLRSRERGTLCALTQAAPAPPGPPQVRVQEADLEQLPEVVARTVAQIEEFQRQTVCACQARALGRPGTEGPAASSAWAATRCGVYLCVSVLTSTTATRLIRRRR